RRLRLAAEPQTGRREVSALTDARKTLAYDFFRILRAPLIDERGNTGRASIAAMNYIANSGIPLRTDSNFPIQHDKVIIVDNVTVETGSFNFTKAAETKNSENAVVIWNMPKLAESFLEHWQDRWNQGRDYRSSY
ncbi:TPA: hypothetical protein HID40_004955, partial [Escherichia coli]|nr:hypothetical protein [Escherichia coli]